MVLSPDTLSLPQLHRAPPSMTAKEAVLPQATCMHVGAPPQHEACQWGRQNRRSCEGELGLYIDSCCVVQTKGVRHWLAHDIRLNRWWIMLTDRLAKLPLGMCMSMIQAGSCQCGLPSLHSRERLEESHDRFGVDGRATAELLNLLGPELVLLHLMPQAPIAPISCSWHPALLPVPQSLARDGQQTCHLDRQHYQPATCRLASRSLWEPSTQWQRRIPCPALT